MALLHPEQGPEGKTERGTEKKRQDARKKGKVVISTEVINFVVIAASLAVFIIILPILRRYLYGFMQLWSQLDLSTEWNAQYVGALFKQASVLCAIGILPVGVTAMIGSTVATMAQTKPFFETETLKLKFDALNPVNGVKQLFSKDSIAKLFLSLLKVFVISIVVWGVVKQQVDELTFLNRLSVTEGMQWFVTLLIRIVIRILALYILIAVLDWIKEKRKFEASIMMTKQEVKDEQKGQESNPQVKQKMRRTMRELSAARMMASVPDSTVVITNPTFLAIAIKYDANSMNAPIVVAKGKRKTAHRIRSLAEENGVPLLERKPLARAMYNKVEIGKPVPAEYYEAVAELLAYLYRMGNSHVRQQLQKQ
jgi:flagellar biosynthetic protein FlhB